MRASLLTWIGEADRLRHIEALNAIPPNLDNEAVKTREEDLYIDMVGELFELLRDVSPPPADCERLANSFVDIASHDWSEKGSVQRISGWQAHLFAAAAFYIGGFPASAYLTGKGLEAQHDQEAENACLDLIGRRQAPASRAVRRLLGALKAGDMAEIETVVGEAVATARQALLTGPTEYIPARLFEKMAQKFRETNLRAVLPDGSADKWSRLVATLVSRSPPTWDYFPSQIQAIKAGLLTSDSSFTLQMPTGAGKTALCETLLYSHAHESPSSAAVLLVPYRSLAGELRKTVVKHLNDMEVVAGCMYGGTVPSGDEVRDLDRIQALVATPETLSGALTANPGFFQRLSLVICDEGHLLDSDSRGISLELLLARLRARQQNRPRCVFVSAIVPNIEEINTWLGGNESSVVRSGYRAALAEFGVLRQLGTGSAASTLLEMHSHETTTLSFDVPNFLPASAFQVVRASTGNRNTYPHTSYKTQAIAAARRVMSLGAVAVFAANKRGNQGAIGLAEELLKQLAVGVPLPKPDEHADMDIVADAADYLRRECGPDWIGTMLLEAGAILHHGDIPQEMREVLEDLLRNQKVPLAICTSTLAEGVNLPIRTLVLYSVRRVGNDGRPQDLLTRDVKNLVGRAGRAGVSTKGLVICANASQWPLVERVAQQDPGENVRGALVRLLGDLEGYLARRSTSLSNAFLESRWRLQPLVDGIDATLIDLAAEEIGELRLAELAERTARETFAASQSDAIQLDLLRQVFALRSQKISEIRASGKLGWLRDSGARARMLAPVEDTLLPLYQAALLGDGSIEETFFDSILTWALEQTEVRRAIRKFFQLPPGQISEELMGSIHTHVALWLSGASFANIASGTKLSVDDALGIQTTIVGYSIQTVVEQGIALLKECLTSREEVLPEAVDVFVERLRYGLPSRACCLLAAAGVRHRAAAVAAAKLIGDVGRGTDDMDHVIESAWIAVEAKRGELVTSLGPLVLSHLLQDLSRAAA